MALKIFHRILQLGLKGWTMEPSLYIVLTESWPSTLDPGGWCRHPAWWHQSSRGSGSGGSGLEAWKPCQTTDQAEQMRKNYIHHGDFYFWSNKSMSKYKLTLSDYVVGYPTFNFCVPLKWRLARMLPRELRWCTMRAGLILNPVTGVIIQCKALY